MTTFNYNSGKWYSSPVGIDGGAFGVIMAKVESWPPPYDLAPQFVTDTPISNQLKISDQHPNGPRIDSNVTVKFADGGGVLAIPSGYRNYYIPADAANVNDKNNDVIIIVSLLIHHIISCLY